MSPQHAQNSVLIVIDCQPEQIATIRSIDAALPLKNVLTTVKIAKGLRIADSRVDRELKEDNLHDEHRPDFGGGGAA